MRDHLEATHVFSQFHAARQRMKWKKHLHTRWLSHLSLGVTFLGYTALAMASSDDSIGQTTDEILPLATQPDVRRQWQDLTYRLPTASLSAVGIDPGDPEVWWLGADGFVFRTDDAGESWSPVLSYPRGLPNPDLDPMLGMPTRDDNIGSATEERAVQLRDDANNLLDFADEVESGKSVNIEDSFGNAATADQLQTWAEDLQMAAAAAQMPAGDAEPANLSFPRQRSGVREIVISRAPMSLVLIATPRGLFRGDLQGRNFVQIRVPGGGVENDIRALSISSTIPGLWFVGTAAGVFMSQDGGQTFRRATGQAGLVGVLDLELSEDEAGTRLWAATEMGLMLSRDKGDTWEEVRGTSLPPGLPVLSVAYDALLDVLYVGTAMGMAIQLAPGRPLEPTPLSLGAPVIHLAVEGNLPGVIAIGTQGAGWLESDDIAASALTDSDVLPAREIRCLAYLPGAANGSILAVTDRGFFGLFPFKKTEMTTNADAALQEKWSHEPTWREVGNAALRYARLDRFYNGKTLPRLQNAAWAPSMRAQYRFFNGRPNRIEYVLVADEISELDADDLEEFAREGNIDINPRTGQRHEFFVFFSWDLDRLVLPPSQVAAARMRPQLQRAEQQILSRTFDLFTARRRLMTDMLKVPDQDLSHEVATRWLRLDELNALLDAQTGGFFQDALQQRQTWHRAGQFSGAMQASTSANAVYSENSVQLAGN